MSKRFIVNIGKNFLVVLGGIMISQFYSIAYLIMTNKWVPMLELMQSLENKGETTSAITVMLFNVMGIAVVIFGIYYTILQIYRYVKENVIKSCK